MDLVKAEGMDGIEKSKAEAIKSTFEPMVKMLEGFESAYKEIVDEANNGISPDVVLRAKRVRLDIGKVRIEADKTRKSQKEEYVRAGKAIDGVFNVLKWAVQEKEDNLKEIENHFANIEKARLAKLQEDRTEMISPYIELDGRDFASMEDDVWEAFFTIKKNAFEKKIADEKQKVLDEEKAKAELEEKRLAEKAEAERIFAEEMEKNRLAKLALAEEERLAKIEAEKIHKAELEKLKIEAEENKKAEIAKAEQKVIDDIEAEKKKSEDAEIERMNNAKHNQKINSEAKEAILKIGVAEVFAVTIVKAIRDGKIPHVSIKY